MQHYKLYHNCSHLIVLFVHLETDIARKYYTCIVTGLSFICTWNKSIKPQILVKPLAVSMTIHCNPLSFHLLGIVHSFLLMATSDHYITSIDESAYCLHNFLVFVIAAVRNLLHFL